MLQSRDDIILHQTYYIYYYKLDGSQDSPKDDIRHVNIFVTVRFNFKLSTRMESVGEALVEYLFFFKCVLLMPTWPDRGRRSETQAIRRELISNPFLHQPRVDAGTRV
jgi:hypothetical protein